MPHADGAFGTSGSEGASADDVAPVPDPLDPSATAEPAPSGPDDDAEVEALLRRIAAEDDDAPSEVESLVYSLQEFAAYVPAGVIDYVRSLTRTEWLAACTLAAADEHYCRRLGEHAVQDRRNRWNGAWTKPEFRAAPGTSGVAAEVAV